MSGVMVMLLYPYHWGNGDWGTMELTSQLDWLTVGFSERPSLKK